MVSITVTGMNQMISAVRTLGEAGKAVNGPIATFGSRLPYASYIETGRSSRAVRRAGPALMFARGIQQTLPQVPAIMLPAIPKGNAAIGQAKRKVRDTGIANIQALTPVLTGALRASVQEMTRPR
jgi:hypothetical protein